MGLLDSVMGAVGGAMAGQVSSALGGALGGSAGGAGSAQMIEGLLAALTSGGGQGGAGLGGLAGLVQQFQQGGLGDVAASWVSTGKNLPISPEQLQGALGNDTMGQLARSMGLDIGQAAGPLAQMLPQVVDALTPNGQLPTGASGGMDLGSLLPQVLGKLMNPST